MLRKISYEFDLIISPLLAQLYYLFLLRIQVQEFKIFYLQVYLQL